MAINSFEKLSDKIGPTIVKSSCSKFSNQNSRRLLKIDNAANDNMSSSNSKCEEFKKIASPYLAEDRIEMLSRITEKRLVHKKTTDFISSFPLAVNIYKASSDEFKAYKKRKKVKKSVLTLPNEPAPLPQLSTVSDMNDSEYNDKIKDERNPKPKRGKIIQTKKKSRICKAKQIFDRDAEYCSRLNIDLDNSSTDMINQFTGDGKKSIKRRNIPKKSNINTHDVWAMLRNMNRFPFRPSPPFSEDSITSMKQRKTSNKHRNTQMDTKFIETCTTEEFTFFSNSFSKSAHNSQSSIDRITVVDKQDAYQEIREELKIANNKNPSYVKNHKDIKKLKSNAKARLRCAKVKCYKGDNVESIGHNDVNLRQRLPKSPRDKVQNQENKLMLPCGATNKPNLGCTNNCFYCHDNKVGNEFNDSDDIDHLYGNSDSSKGDIIKAITGASPTSEEQNKSNKISPCASKGQMNGITKVVLSKGQNIVSTKRVDLPNRKPRLVTTMPSATIHPKLTQADIKRRLANIKFPLVILSKDQLTSTPFRVASYEPPHLAGLNEHIWPFMQKWQKRDSKVIATRYSSMNDDKSTGGMKGDCIGNHMKINKGNNSLVLRDRNTVQLVSLPNADNIKAPKMKPMRQIKERMLQFLHKTSPCDKANKKSRQELSNRCEEMFKNVTDVGTNTQRNLVILRGQEKIIVKKGEKMLDYVPSNIKQPCAKGRWASDFIDNVIKKIKNGVYYNQEEKEFSRNRFCNTKEDSVQTDINIIKHTCCKDCVKKSKSDIEENDKICDLFQYIPGFDDKPSDLQIETIDKNQIAIKHCITNIVVQFDVAMPSKINNVLNNYQSFTCRPVSVTESHTNIFKSNTTIVNAMLPAELCSILPNTIRTIVNSKLDVLKIVDKVETQLTAITELPPCKSDNNVKHLIPVHIDVSPPLRIVGKGKFPNNNTIISNKTFNMIGIKNLSFEELYRWKKPDLLPKIQTNQLLIFRIDEITLRGFKSYHLSQFIPEIDCKAVDRKTSTSMELQPYLLSNKQVIPSYKFNILEMLSVILGNQSFNIQLNVLLINPFFNLCDKKGVNIISMGAYTKDNEVSCIISDITVNSIDNGFQESLEDNNTLPNILKKNTIDKLIVRKQKNKFSNCKSGIEYCVTNRNKKRTFVKLYKKCKSMSNMSNERSSTALRKITNLDDFFLALGSSKLLASAIDGTTARKILTSIKEMNSWINEITPRQALLILLLANKKDTPNLLRYRQVILQGIAVKRITRASELDLEVEVIEREKLNTFSPFEGISYLPASVENQDCLLEELYWIAKTTASDYQKPFDESSERLLKSLLEKRKKLNPSYLRVMARYVGLGLLKSPK